MKKLKKILAIFCCILPIAAFSACSDDKGNLVLSADKTVALRGEEVTLTSLYKTEEGETSQANGVSYVITSGADSGSITGNVLKIKETALSGAEIKVVAKADEKTSNEVIITVSVPLEGITISTNGVANVQPGSFMYLTKTFAPNDSDAKDKDVEWVITEGTTICSISNDMLFVSGQATIGSTIKFKAVYGEIESNEISVVVGIPVENIAISTVGFGAEEIKMLTGNTATLSAQITPVDASITEITWVATQGAYYVEFSNNILVVKSGTPYGTVIKVKATCGGIESSNELVFQYGVALEDIQVNVVGSTNIQNGSSRALNVVQIPANATGVNVTWEITQGADLCSIANNIITINDDAEVGSIIKFKAVSGEIESDEISIVVGTPIETITISAVGFGTEEIKLLTTNTSALNVQATPSGASTAGITWYATQGGDYVEFSNNTLVVKSGTPYGTIIKVKAKSGNVQSTNELVFQYGVAVESVEISASALEIVKGNNAVLNAVVNPSNATDNNVLYYITEGEEYAEIISNTLVVKATADTGATIKVKGIVGGVESSNELVFTVMQTKEEENATKYMISLSDDRIKLDTNAGSLPILEVEVYDRNFNEVTDKKITYTIVEGAEFINIIEEGYSCSFEILGHGSVILEVGIEGSDVVEEVVIDVVKPPEIILLPEVFAERSGFVYNFSRVNPFNDNAIETLPFVATTLGDKVCQDLRYTFKHEDGTTGDDVAIYENGAISFNKVGKVTVIVSSNSGSQVETTAEYVFNINEGFNVYTFEQLQSLADDSRYNGQQINIVVLEKPDSSALANYEYGFDLVSAAGLKAKEDQTFEEVFTGTYASGNGQRINFVCKNVHLNGNRHKIDLSQVRPITKAEIDAKKASNSSFSWENFSSVVSIIPWTSNSNVVLGGSYQAKVYDLEIVGNTPVDYSGDFSGIKPLGVLNNGLSIGANNHDTLYYIDVNNISISKCRTGLVLGNIVGNGLVQNANIYNCFGSAMDIAASIVRLKDITMGSCGAFCIEMNPKRSNEAGESHNQLQTVTFEGYMHVENAKNSGDTVYFENYKVLGYTIPQVVQGQLQRYSTTQDQLSHFRDENGNFGFICYVLADFSTLVSNNTVCNYPAYQEGGIIKAEDIPTSGINTTHQFIEVEVDLSAMGLGKVGKVLLYNNNYGK